MDNSVSNTKPEVLPKEADHPFLIAGIGASAGGVQALQRMFENITANSGIAYIVILHLSPNHSSQLTSILQNVAHIPVTEATERVKVEPDHAYVVSPNSSLKMVDGHLDVTAIQTWEERRAPIDIFFRTLAESHASYAAAVVLSGTGADGSMGLKRIKEKGGIVLAQNPAEAEYADMPRNAIETALVDGVLNVTDIPRKLLSYRENIGTVSLPYSTEQLEQNQQVALEEVFAQLRIRTGHDFSNYKKPTLLRRLERRMNIKNVQSLAQYATILSQAPEEVHSLLKDLLISVTNFFRDPKAFEFLETQVIPAILKTRNPQNDLRIWVAGCATGEEAYSVAMLVLEQIERLANPPSVQIFATDIDTSALAHAREGFYTHTDAADVSAERLSRFFTKEGSGYRAVRDLRRIILFTNHNALKDPPFSKLDLVTCRNLLIYFDPIAQNRMMETFHFALTPGSYLFLGSSETADNSIDLYAVVSKQNQVYQSRQVAVRLLSLHEPSRFLSRSKDETARLVKEKAILRQDLPLTERISFGDLHQRLLEQYAPPSIVVNEAFEMVHVSPGAGRFLRVPGGEPTKDISSLILSGLRLQMRNALYNALHYRKNVEVRGLTVVTGNGTELINLLVRPVLRPDDTARGYLLIVFEPAKEANKPDVLKIEAADVEKLSTHLEQELVSTKLELRFSNQQFEVQTEELKGSNEELQAMNEELRSVAEELETSKEELQSINEELITVNQELKTKVDELSQSNNNFQNLINSLNIGTIFLDRNFYVKLFTPTVNELFSLMITDIGRSLFDISSKVNYADIKKDAETVLTTLQTVSREISVGDGLTYLMQTGPYRTTEYKISGVVIAFVNISARKQAEEASRVNERSLHMAISAARMFSWEFDVVSQAYSFSGSAASILGVPESGLPLTAEDVYTLVHPDDKELVEGLFAAFLKEGKDFSVDFRSLKQSGEVVWLSVQTIVTTNAAGKPEKLIGISQDISERKQAEEAVRRSEERYRAIFNQATACVSELDAAGNFTLVNDTFCLTLGYTEKELLGMNVREVTHPDNLEQCMKVFAEAVEQGLPSTEIKKLVRKDDSCIWLTESISCLENENGELKRVVAVGIDITNRKKAEEALYNSEERYRIALEAGELATWDWYISTNEVNWNAQHYRLFGIEHEEGSIDPEYFLSFIYPEDLPRVKNELMNVLGENGIYSAEFRIRRRDNGQLRWMSGYGRVTERDGNSKPLRVSGVMYDSTDRREAEENLEATQNSLNTALEAAKMGVWNMDLAYGYMDRSPKHDQLLGYQSWQENWDFEKAKQHLDKNDQVKFDEAYTRLLQEGVFELEARVNQNDGSACWVYYYGRSFRDDDGKTERAAGVIFDITDRKTIEKQKDEFIGIASHELKTPVTSIKAYAEILQEMFTEAHDDMSANLMSKLDGQVDRLTKLIKDLLDVTKVSEGQLDLTTEVFSIEKMTQNMVEEMQRTTRQHRVILNLNAMAEVTGDQERLGQVLTNLLSNAIKYSPESKDVLVDARDEGGKIIISVQDFGIGMSPGTLEKLFARFFRSDNPSVRSYPGLGLGLYISMEIMKRHGGTITVQSERGKGSIFTMILPHV